MRRLRANALRESSAAHSSAKAISTRTPSLQHTTFMRNGAALLYRVIRILRHWASAALAELTPFRGSSDITSRWPKLAEPHSNKKASRPSESHSTYCCVTMVYSPHHQEAVGEHRTRLSSHWLLSATMRDVKLIANPTLNAKTFDRAIAILKREQEANLPSGKQEVFSRLQRRGVLIRRPGPHHHCWKYPRVQRRNVVAVEGRGNHCSHHNRPVLSKLGTGFQAQVAGKVTSETRSESKSQIPVQD